MSHFHLTLSNLAKSFFVGSKYVLGINNYLDNDLEMTFDDFTQPCIIIYTPRKRFLPKKYNMTLIYKTEMKMPHLYRIDMKNSLDANSEKWQPSWK